MNITTSDANGVKIVEIEGKLDTNTCSEAEKHLTQLLDGGTKKVLLEFDKLEFISSAGLRVVLSTAKRLEADGGELRICSLNETMHEIFEISGFGMILNVHDSAAEALDGF